MLNWAAILKINSKLKNAIITSVVTSAIISILGGIGYLIMIGYTQPRINSETTAKLITMETACINGNKQVNSRIDGKEKIDSLVLVSLNEIKNDIKTVLKTQEKQTKVNKLIFDKVDNLKPFVPYLDIYANDCE